MSLRIMNDFRNVFRPGRVVAVAISILVGLASTSTTACGVNKKEADEAKRSVYDAEFAIVFSAAVAAVRELYPRVEEDPSTGVIKTAWHQVKYNDPGADDPKSVQSRDQTAGVGAASPGGALGYNPSLARRVNFIRFDVHVAGGRPWRVRVVGTASQLEPGNALPTELRGASKPHWLPGRVDALTVAIHRRLKKYAQPAPVYVEVVEEEAPKAQVGGDIPDGAREAAQAIVAALQTRDYAALRATCADDVVWSLGAAPGVDSAMAMWQADPGVFAQMQKAIGAGCAKDGAEVVCPAGAPRGAWQLRLAQRGGAWKLAAFVIIE
ncbi:MAG TPA: hypothetical protein VM261_17820 [Kofleriaceae bacterium]|nr:hypothetical protein [Kofleriaceae bacterium]